MQALAWPTSSSSSSMQDAAARMDGSHLNKRPRGQPQGKSETKSFGAVEVSSTSRVIPTNICMRSLTSSGVSQIDADAELARRLAQEQEDAALARRLAASER